MELLHVLAPSAQNKGFSSKPSQGMSVLTTFSIGVLCPNWEQGAFSCLGIDLCRVPCRNRCCHCGRTQRQGVGVRLLLAFVGQSCCSGAWFPMLPLGDDGLTSALPLSSGLYCVHGKSAIWCRGGSGLGAA